MACPLGFQGWIGSAAAAWPRRRADVTAFDGAGAGEFPPRRPAPADPRTARALAATAPAWRRRARRPRHQGEAFQLAEKLRLEINRSDDAAGVAQHAVLRIERGQVAPGRDRGRARLRRHVVQHAPQLAGGVEARADRGHVGSGVVRTEQAGGRGLRIDQVEIVVALAAGGVHALAARGQAGDLHAGVADECGRAGVRIDFPEIAVAGRQEKAPVAGDRHAEIERLRQRLVDQVQRTDVRGVAVLRTDAQQAFEIVRHGVQVAARVVGESFDVRDALAVEVTGRTELDRRMGRQIDLEQRVECLAVAHDIACRGRTRGDGKHKRSWKSAQRHGGSRFRYLVIVIVSHYASAAAP